MPIHSSAVVHRSAKIAPDAQIGPFCVIEAGVEIAAGCVLESHVVVKEGVTLGPRNHVFEGAVLGGLPQHLRVPQRVGRVIVGADNTIRENVTVHRALDEHHVTCVGSHNLLMVGVHIAHDCLVGSNTIFANGAMIAGHVIVEDRAYVSGAVAVHQFCRIGRYAMVGGLARVVKDVPPFVTVDGGSGYVVGLNTVGLRRNGFTQDQITELKAAYRLIYRSNMRWTDILAQLESQFAGGPAECLAGFLAATKRGIVSERRLPSTATIKLRSADDEGEDELPQLRAKAG